jgi:hypothetical protein
MSPKRLILLWISLMSVLAAGAAWAGEEEPPVSIQEVSGTSSATGGGSDICSEPVCSTNSESSTGAVQANQTHSVVLDPDDQTLLVATASGSVDASGVVPGLSDEGTAAFALELVTTVPVLLEVSGSVGTQDGANGLMGLQGTHIDGQWVVAADGFEISVQGAFSEVLPPGAIRIGGTVSTHQVVQNGGEGSASFSVTVTLSREGGDELRWVNAAGGSWNDADNWDPARVPGPEDTTVFDLAATYDVSFSAGAAAPSSRGTFETCASPNSARNTRIRKGAVSYTGVVDFSTLSDSPADPGLRVGGLDDFDDPLLTLGTGELCSLFSTVGDIDVIGSATVELLGGTWTNSGRLRVGGRGDGLVRIGAGRVVAGETRVAQNKGGTIEVTGANSELDAGALLLAEPGAIGHAIVHVSQGASLQTEAALVGGAPAICLTDLGSPTDLPCAVDSDCASLGTFADCQRKHQVIVREQGTWTAFDTVRVGGGIIVADDGTELPAPGNGALRVGLGVNGVSMPRLELGFDTVTPGDQPADVSRGYLEVLGQIDVLGLLIVGAGGAGVVEILPPGRVDVTGRTLVGRLALKPPLLGEDDPFVPGPFRHGMLRAIGPAVGPLFTAPELIVRPRGVVELDEARIEVSERMFVIGGQLTGVGTVATPDFEVSATGRIGPVSPVVVNRSASPRGAAAASGLVIEGNLTMGSDGIVSIASTGPGACGRVSVTGDANLGGTLELAFAGGYLPAAGDTCDVLSVGGTTIGGFERIVARGVAEGFVYEAPTAPDGSIRFEALSAATACAGGDMDGDGIADCEICDNCVDDTGNGFVDRADPDCVAPADGDGLGLADAGQAAALLKCHRGLQSATQQLATKTWKDLQRCTDAMMKCQQRQPDDPQCLAKAEAKCAKAAAKLASAKGHEAKARARIEKGCGALPIDALLDATGLGHAAAGAACASVGVTSLASASDLAACSTRRQLCQLGGLIGAATPRTGELLAAAGVAESLSCLGGGADGGGLGLGDPKGAGQRALSCQKAVGKAANKLLGQTLSAKNRCEAAALACVQRAPGDAGCLAKASSLCSKEQGKLASAEAKFQQALDKKCGDKKGQPLVALEDLLADAGLGFGAGAERCDALGTPALDSRDAVGACLVAENQCRAGKLGAAASPRSFELLTLGGLE